jgi:hypothetical protein
LPSIFFVILNLYRYGYITVYVCNILSKVSKFCFIVDCMFFQNFQTQESQWDSWLPNIVLWEFIYITSLIMGLTGAWIWKLAIHISCICNALHQNQLNLYDVSSEEIRKNILWRMSHDLCQLQELISHIITLDVSWEHGFDFHQVRNCGCWNILNGFHRTKLFPLYNFYLALFLLL